MIRDAIARCLTAAAGTVFALALVSAAEPTRDAKAEAERKFTSEELEHFEKQVLPVLQRTCFRCHGDDPKPKGELRLTSRENILKGGVSGPAVSVEKPDESRLLQAINHRDGLEMPPTGGRLAQDKIDILTKWVKAGVPMPRGDAPAIAQGGKVTDEARRYWAYQPIKRPAVPEFNDAAKTRWVANPIDALILAKLAEKGLSPAPPADPIALVRRVYYDLTGLPPTPDEVDAFVKDPSLPAYERLIDKLLASPHYGEKWGRHWLDLVRYAETNGYERDGAKPNAWRYRDYVIKSFNADKPYDRFIREQIAGDEMAAGSPNPDPIIATGYYRLGVWDDEPADPKQARFDELDDIVATTAQVFLAMTMNCARCHDHKADPLPQSDYYRLLSFFQDVQHYSPTRDVRSIHNTTDISPPEVRAKYEKELQAREARKAELTAAMMKIEDEAIKKMPAEDQRAAEGNDRPQVVQKIKPFLTPEQDGEYTKLKEELAALKKRPELARDLALSVNNCLTNPPQTHVMIRGSPHAPGAKVEPGFPIVLGFNDPVIPAAENGARTSGRRSVLADWIASPQNPLTARVMVNRIWQHHFGRAIVPTPNDFGKFGQLPTNPELLDWLASEFMAPLHPSPLSPGGRGAGGEGAWSIKRMHRLIMTSNAYRMSVQASADGLQLDPENSLHWRFNMRRLNAEEVRDSVLAVTGTLNLKAGGPSIYPPIPREVLAGQSRPGEGWPVSSREESARRSVYVHIKRSLLVPILSQHDQADTDSSCPVRYTTTVPTQSLGMMNGEFTNEQATAFAERLQHERPGDLAAQVRRAIRLTTGRQPGEAEVAADIAFVRELMAKHGMDEKRALRQYCLLAHGPRWSNA